jgi:inositol-hexakisphosphate kinase
MSATRPDSNNTSKPAELRRSTQDLQKQGINATHHPTPAAEDVPLKPLFKVGRSETAPIAVSGRLWSSTRDRLQLTERDTIFATHYVSSQSPPLSDSTHNGNLLANVEQSLGGAFAGKVKTSPRSSRKQTQVTFANDTEPRHSERKKAQTYQPKVHELLRDEPDSSTLKKATSMGIEGKQSDRSRRAHHSSTQRPTTSPSYNLDTIDEAERARYRSWREGNAPWVGSGATAKRRSRSGDNMHVDKNIEATLPRFDPPVTSFRSRKSSQYLGLFKEKDVAEQQKRRDQKVKDRSETFKELPERDQSQVTSSLYSEDASAIHGQLIAEPEELEPSIKSTFEALSHGGPQSGKDLPVRLPRHITDLSVSTDKRPRTSPVPVQKAPKSLSTRLVEEMKHVHDIELTSDSERLLSQSYQAKRERSRLSSPKVRTPTEEYSEYVARRESDESTGKSPLSDEDELSEHEQISKALYYPHRHIAAEDEEQYHRESSPCTVARAIEEARSSEEPLTPNTEQELIEANERASNEVALSLETADETEYFHGDLPPALTSPADEDSYTSSHDLTYSGSEYETAYESSSSDEAGATPKASPKSRSTRHPEHYQPSAPVDAIELKPFNHQVGGHSTVYRFSRRAICKQLNNRENIVYETVERWHPEVLTFMPRYASRHNM